MNSANGSAGVEAVTHVQRVEDRPVREPGCPRLGDHNLLVADHECVHRVGHRAGERPVVSPG
jgi:hypothetical protein